MYGAKNQIDVSFKFLVGVIADVSCFTATGKVIINYQVQLRSSFHPTKAKTKTITHYDVFLNRSRSVDTKAQWAFRSSQCRVYWKLELVHCTCDILVITSQLLV